MRRGILTALTAVLLGGLAFQGAEAEDKVYGDGVSEPDTMMVSALLATPDKFVGEVVRVQGTAVGVCAHRGCWINVASDVEGDVVRVKVPDGEIVFPPEIIGEMVVVEGVWTANKLDMETSKAYCERQAESKGEKFDPKDMTGCVTLYQISGTGALVMEREATEEAEETET